MARGNLTVYQLEVSDKSHLSKVKATGFRDAFVGGEVIISVGKNQYGHPSETVLKYFRDRKKIQVHITLPEKHVVFNIETELNDWSTVPISLIPCHVFRSKPCHFPWS